MDFTIRLESPSDSEAIHRVTTAAFLTAPHTDHTEQFIVDALRAAGALTLSLVAVRGDEIMGHGAISPVAIADGTPNWYGLGPVSVLPQHQGQGIGSSLIQSALNRLKAQGAAGCVVLGDPGYYSRFGFQPLAGLMYSDGPPEYFQALAFAPPLPRGVVTYHAAFGARG